VSNRRWVAGRCRWPGEGEIGNRSEVSGAGRKWGIGGLSAGLPADLGGVQVQVQVLTIDTSGACG
jgi:hypothetical protein